VNLIIGIDGAVCGYFLVYLLPSLVHLKCIDNTTAHNKFIADWKIENPESIDEEIVDPKYKICMDHNVLKIKYMKR